MVSQTSEHAPSAALLAEIERFAIGFDPRDRARLHELWDGVIDSQRWTEGPLLERFEAAWAEWNGVPALATSGWSGAALPALEYAGVRGQTVLCPSNTFPATAHAIVAAGATPVFVDCNRDDLCVSLADFEAKLAEHRPRAAWLVHIGGHIAFEVEAIAELCRAEGVFLLEDCAHAHGASWHGRKAGTWGDAGVWSLYATKTVSTGEGGVLSTRDPELLEFARRHRNYGKPEYEVTGVNSRMSEFTAAIGLVQLERLEEIVRWKNAAARALLDPRHPDRLQLPDGMTSGLYKYLVFDEIERSTGKVYDLPCHRLFATGQDLPNSDWVAENHWCAPLYYRPEAASLQELEAAAWRVLVTGGAGFIGSHVVDALQAAGHQPRVFDVRPSPHHPRGSLDTAIGNVLDPGALRAAMKGCDAVTHLAAAADVGEVAEDPAAAEELNSRGTLNVLEAARAAGVDRVIYASTIWVYGACDGSSVDEDTPLGLPDHLYTATKLSGEMYCRSYSELYGLDSTVLRFGIPYGPRARPAAVIPAFVNRALAGEAITIAGSGEQHRRFVYVEDLAQGVARALAPQAANRTYNLVGSEDVSVRRIADTVRDLVGDVDVMHTEGRTGDFGGVEVSGERAAAELGWRPATGFDEGVGRYLAWHRDQAAAEGVARSARPVAARPGLASAGTAAAALIGALGLLGAYLVALYNVAGEDATRTVLAVMLTALAVGTLVTRREVRGWGAAAGVWVVAIAGATAVALPWPRHLLDMARPDVTVTLLCMGGVGFAAALVAGRRRMALERARDEQTQDSGS